MAPELLNEIIDKAALRAVEEYAKTHPCRLTDSERALIHAQHAAMVEEGANHGTFRIIIQMGKSWQDVTGGLRKFGMLVLIGIVIVGVIVWNAFK